MVDSVALLLVSGMAAGAQSQYRTILISLTRWFCTGPGHPWPPDYTRIVPHTFVRPWEVTRIWHIHLVKNLPKFPRISTYISPKSQKFPRTGKYTFWGIFGGPPKTAISFFNIALFWLPESLFKWYPYPYIAHLRPKFRTRYIIYVWCDLWTWSESWSVGMDPSLTLWASRSLYIALWVYWPLMIFLVCPLMSLPTL